jgi:hypothetical protein
MEHSLLDFSLQTKITMEETNENRLQGDYTFFTRETPTKGVSTLILFHN